MTARLVLQQMLRDAQQTGLASSVKALHRLLASTNPYAYMPSYEAFRQWCSGANVPSYDDMLAIQERWGQASPPHALRPARVLAWEVGRLTEELADCGRLVDSDLTLLPDATAAELALASLRLFLKELP